MALQHSGQLRVRGYRQVVAVALACAMMSTSRAGVADTSRDAKQEAKARFVSGQSHYNLNEFSEALLDFKEAYRLYPDPVFLYNLGQCERQLEHDEEAIRFYRSFLRERPKASNRQEVLHKIEELETAQKNKQAEAEAEKLAPVDATGVSAAGSSAIETAANGTSAATVQPRTSPSASPESPVGSSPPPAAGVEADHAVAPSPISPTSLATVPPTSAGDVAPPPAAAAVPDARIDLSAQAIAPTPAPVAHPAFYSRWWFWAATGAVLVGSAIGIYAASAGASASPPGSVLGTKKVF
jgi:hypothetical protein